LRPQGDDQPHRFLLAFVLDKLALVAKTEAERPGTAKEPAAGLLIGLGLRQAECLGSLGQQSGQQKRGFDFWGNCPGRRDRERDVPDQEATVASPREQLESESVGQLADGMQYGPAQQPASYYPANADLSPIRKGQLTGPGCCA
jgi:hypothetical protein